MSSLIEKQCEQTFNYRAILRKNSTLAAQQTVNIKMKLDRVYYQLNKQILTDQSTRKTRRSVWASRYWRSGVWVGYPPRSYSENLSTSPAHCGRRKSAAAECIAA